jgi:hypothetical protein
MGGRPTANCSRPTAAVETSPQTSGILPGPSIREFTPSPTPTPPVVLQPSPADETRRDDRRPVARMSPAGRCPQSTRSILASRRAATFPASPSGVRTPMGGSKTIPVPRGKRAQLNFFGFGTKNGGATHA